MLIAFQIVYGIDLELYSIGITVLLASSEGASLNHVLWAWQVIFLPRGLTLSCSLPGRLNQFDQAGGFGFGRPCL